MSVAAAANERDSVRQQRAYKPRDKRKMAAET